MKDEAVGRNRPARSNSQPRRLTPRFLAYASRSGQSQTPRRSVATGTPHGSYMSRSVDEEAVVRDVERSFRQDGGLHAMLRATRLKCRLARSSSCCTSSGYHGALMAIALFELSQAACQILI